LAPKSHGEAMEAKVCPEKKKMPEITEEKESNVDFSSGLPHLNRRNNIKHFNNKTFRILKNASIYIIIYLNS